MLPAEYPRHRPVPSTLCHSCVWSCRFWRPLFRGRETSIHEAVPAEFPAIIEVVEEGAPERQEHPALFPLPEPAPARGQATVPRRQLAPRRPRSEDPEDALETPAGIGAWPASPGVGISHETDAVESAPTARRWNARHTMPSRYRSSPHSQVLKWLLVSEGRSDDTINVEPPASQAGAAGSMKSVRGASWPWKSWASHDVASPSLRCPLLVPWSAGDPRRHARSQALAAAGRGTWR